MNLCRLYKSRNNNLTRFYRRKTKKFNWISWIRINLKLLHLIIQLKLIFLNQ